MSTGVFARQHPAIIQKALVFNLIPIFFVIRKGTFIWKKKTKSQDVNLFYLHTCTHSC